MKIRTGFVSNSSSSSFICCITDEIEDGWDLGIEEAGMYECRNGHIFKQEFVINSDDPDLDDDDPDLDDDYEIDPIRCPICQFKFGDKHELLTYLLWSSGITEEKVLLDIRAKFGNWSAFNEYLKHTQKTLTLYKGRNYE